MFCPHCGKENVSAFGYCGGCQKPLTTLEGAQAMPGFAPQIPSAPKVMGIPARFFLVLTILLALLVSVMKPVDTADAAEAAGEHFGALLALLGLPLLVAFLVAGRKKARNPNRFVLVFCLISGLLILGNTAVMLVPEPAPKRFARLMREAAGTQPVRHTGFPSQRKFDDAVRQQYGKLLQQNREYMKAVKDLPISDVKYLNAAKGFASPEAERQGLEQLHTLYATDMRHEQDVKETLQGLRHIFEGVNPPSEREAMLQGFDESLAAQLNRRQQSLAMEKAWVDAVDDLHAYADAHRGSIHVVDNKVLINDSRVRGEFNAKLSLEKEKRLAFVKAQAEFKKSQAEMLQKVGLSDKDISGK